MLLRSHLPAAPTPVAASRRFRGLPCCWRRSRSLRRACHGAASGSLAEVQGDLAQPAAHRRHDRARTCTTSGPNRRCSPNAPPRCARRLRSRSSTRRRRRCSASGRRAPAHERARRRQAEPDGVWEGNLYLRGGGDPTFGRQRVHPQPLRRPRRERLLARLPARARRRHPRDHGLDLRRRVLLRLAAAASPRAAMRPRPVPRRHAQRAGLQSRRKRA